MPRVGLNGLGVEGTVEIRVTAGSCIGKKGSTSLRGVSGHRETGDITTLPSALRALGYVVMFCCSAVKKKKVFTKLIQEVTYLGNTIEDEKEMFLFCPDRMRD